MMNNFLRYPSYRLLPWEIEEALNYAYESVQHFVNNGQIEREFKLKQANGYTDTFEKFVQDKIDNAQAGYAGERGFKELLKEKNKKTIIEWTGEKKIFGAEYDFLAGSEENKFTIDVKTSMTSKHVRIPDQCNFVYGFYQNNQKMSSGIPLCDFYVQMFYEKLSEEVFYVGTLSRALIMNYASGNKIWDDRRKGYALIYQENFDSTSEFLTYLEPQTKADLLAV